MYLHHALINTLSVHMTHINLNTIFFTHAEYSPTETMDIQYWKNAHTHTHTHTHTSLREKVYCTLWPSLGDCLCLCGELCVLVSVLCVGQVWPAWCCTSASWPSWSRSTPSRCLPSGQCILPSGQCCGWWCSSVLGQPASSLPSHKAPKQLPPQKWWLPKVGWE